VGKNNGNVSDLRVRKIGNLLLIPSLNASLIPRYQSFLTTEKSAEPKKRASIIYSKSYEYPGEGVHGKVLMKWILLSPNLRKRGGTQRKSEESSLLRALGMFERHVKASYRPFSRIKMDSPGRRQLQPFFARL